MNRTTLVDDKPIIRYLKPGDGKISELKVQCATWPYPMPEHVRWKQVSLKNKTPWVIQMIYWLISSVPNLATGYNPEDQAQKPSRMRAGQNEAIDWEEVGRWIHTHTTKEWWLLYLKWPLGCIVILVLVCFAESYCRRILLILLSS
jgi:hypothetical protein